MKSTSPVWTTDYDLVTIDCTHQRIYTSQKKISPLSKILHHCVNVYNRKGRKDSWLITSVSHPESGSSQIPVRGRSASKLSVTSPRATHIACQAWIFHSVLTSRRGNYWMRCICRSGPLVLSHDIMHKNLGAPRYDDGDRQGDDSGCISYQCLLGLH